jgi:3D-(3,5/4)-trihydroxycyclohexane-1,2-dione acylhydrolase (decyclizing)
LQQATGGASFNNLLSTPKHVALPAIDFVKHAESLGAETTRAASVAELEAAFALARRSSKTHVIVIDTDPMISTDAGGHWWDVAVPEVSSREAVRSARQAYEKALETQWVGN